MGKIKIVEMKVTLFVLLFFLLMVGSSQEFKPELSLLAKYDENGSFKGNPAFTRHGKFVYIIFTASSRMGKICRHNLETGENIWSPDLFPTISTNDPSHNDAAIAVDGDGYIHVWIGMHNHRMKYYRSNSPDDFRNFTLRNEEMPGYFDTGVDEKRYTYPSAVTSSNGDVFIALRRTGMFWNDKIQKVSESQYDEKQDLYHWDNKKKRWSVKLIMAQKGRNAYMSYLHADEKNRVHIVTAWSQIHQGANTFQKATYLCYDVTNDSYSKADGTIINVPVDVDTEQADLLYEGEMAWNDTICEIQTPRVALDYLGNPIATFPYNENNYSKDYPHYVLNIAHWNGNRWNRKQFPAWQVKKYSRPPIGCHGNNVYVFVCEGSDSYFMASFDNGNTFPVRTPIPGTSQPIAIMKIDENTFLMITRMNLFKISCGE